MGRRFGYSQWDGTQAGAAFDAGEVLDQMADEILYHGDPNAALRRLLQSGFRPAAGERVRGTRELLEQLRRRRNELLDRHDAGGAYRELARQLGRIVATERRELDEVERQARSSGNDARRRSTDEVVAERRLQLDVLPRDLAGRVEALRSYAFVSTEARQQFDELLDRLRAEVLQAHFNRMAGAMSDLGPAGRERLRAMFSALNDLLDQRAAGEDTEDAFARFMEDFGDLVPGRPRTLDELVEAMARQMAALSSLLASMTPEQRAQLQRLSDQLLDDLDLRWQVERLRHNLREAFPAVGWDAVRPFAGASSPGLVGGAGMVDRLGALDALEELLSSAPHPGALADVDLDEVARLLGPDAARSLARLSELARLLGEAGLVDARGGRLELTPEGLRRVGRKALADLFARLGRGRFGGHPVAEPGAGHERAEETKPYEFGDRFDVNIERTVANAVRRGGRGTPVRLAPEDFEVERAEASTRAATVVMVDLSLSMPMRDNFVAAKRVAVALHALISSRYPRDYLAVVGFSEVARQIPARELAAISWDFVYGTNIQHGLLLARTLLARQSGTRQIVLVTDGEPTAHIGAGGEVVFHYPPLPETVDATLAEVARCTRAGIRINTFALDATPHLRHFVARLTRLNRGRAFFTTPGDLGDYVLVDFLDRRARSARRAAG